MISIAKEINPDGIEYIIAERFPENRLPTSVLIKRTQIPCHGPRSNTDKRIKTCESPILAPGKIIGGNKFSNMKVSVAKVANTPARQTFKIFVFLIFHQRQGI